MPRPASAKCKQDEAVQRAEGHAVRGAEDYGPQEVEGVEHARLELTRERVSPEGVRVPQ